MHDDVREFVNRVIRELKRMRVLDSLKNYYWDPLQNREALKVLTPLMFEMKLRGFEDRITGSIHSYFEELPKWQPKKARKAAKRSAARKTPSSQPPGQPRTNGETWLLRPAGKK